MIFDDGFARGVTLGDRFAEAMQLLLHTLELQLAALLAHVKMLVGQLGELRFDLVALLTACFAGAGDHLVGLPLEVVVLLDELAHFRIVGWALATGTEPAHRRRICSVAAARAASAAWHHSARHSSGHHDGTAATTKTAANRSATKSAAA